MCWLFIGITKILRKHYVNLFLPQHVAPLQLSSCAREFPPYDNHRQRSRNVNSNDHEVYDVEDHDDDDDEMPFPKKIHPREVSPRDPGTGTPSRSSCGCANEHHYVGPWMVRKMMMMVVLEVVVVMVVVMEMVSPGCWASCPTPGGLGPRQRHSLSKTPGSKTWLESTTQLLTDTKTIVAQLIGIHCFTQFLSLAWKTWGYNC